MLIRLRKYFAELTQEELELFWREYQNQRGEGYKHSPFTDGLALFDFLHEKGVYHCEITSGMTLEHRHLIARMYGQET